MTPEDIFPYSDQSPIQPSSEKLLHVRDGNQHSEQQLDNVQSEKNFAMFSHELEVFITHLPSGIFMEEGEERL